MPWGSMGAFGPVAPLAEAIAEVMWKRFHIGPWARSPRPAPAPPLAGASPPPGQALASVIFAEMVLLHRFHWAGKTRCVF